MPYNKVVDRVGNILIDLTGDTITADKVALGETFHDKYGNVKIGNKADFAKKLEDKFLDLTRVNFVDYDGTLIASYTVEEARNLTALPDFPDHSDIGLVADGWSEELEYVKSLNYGFIIGLHVKPIDNAMVIELIGNAGETYTMKIYSSSYNSTDKYKYKLRIEWGDGDSLEDYVNSSSSYKNFTHTYQKTGVYTIRIHSEEPFFFPSDPGIFSTKAHRKHILRINISSYCTSISIGSDTTNLTELTYPKYMYNGNRYSALGQYTGSNCYSTRLSCLILPHSNWACGPNAGTFNVTTLVCSSVTEYLGAYCQPFNDVYNITLPEAYKGSPQYLIGVAKICRNPTFSLPPNINYIYSELNYGLENINIPLKVIKCMIPTFKTKDSVKIPPSVTDLISDYGISWAILDMTSFDAPPTLDSGQRLKDNGTLILLSKKNVDAFKAATNWSMGISKFVVVDENE